MKNLIFLGPPGCGKGTQAERISKFGYIKLSTGELFREMAKQDTELGKNISKTLTRGDLVSDEMVNQLINDFYYKASDKHNIVLDGYPRNVEQAKVLDSILVKYNAQIDKVFHFAASNDALVKRVTGRYTCNDCGMIYNSSFYASTISGKCDECGSTNLNKRSDDSIKVIQNRLDIFKKSTEPLLVYYEDRLINIDAEQSADLVSKDIMQHLIVE